jgi:hypothetical protein
MCGSNMSFFPFKCGQIQTFTSQIQIQICGPNSDLESFKKQTPPKKCSLFFI